MLAVSSHTAALGHAGAVLGESEQLIGLGDVAVHVGERRSCIAGGEVVDGRAGVRDTAAKRRGIRSHSSDGLGRTPRPPHALGELRGLLIELVLNQLAQLRDAQVAGPHLVGTAGDRIVIEPVHAKRVTQMSAGGGERLA
ncbi:hypothetical protein [Agromyces ramosus]|uniref:hypothetical protein n=1 Tax=Agromyces ramosus TaxID=33879 RepID=UPI0013EEB480|nr:hypothetical protein [Agromyces ramosus]